MVPTIALALMLPIGAIGARESYDDPCAGHMQSTDPLQRCYDEQEGITKGQAAQADEPYRILEETIGYECVPTKAWRQQFVATYVVVRRDGQVEGLPFDQAWALATSGEAWALLLCREA